MYHRICIFQAKKHNVFAQFRRPECSCKCQNKTQSTVDFIPFVVNTLIHTWCVCVCVSMNKAKHTISIISSTWRCRVNVMYANRLWNYLRASSEFKYYLHNVDVNASCECRQICVTSPLDTIHIDRKGKSLSFIFQFSTHIDWKIIYSIHWTKPLFKCIIGIRLICLVVNTGIERLPTIHIPMNMCAYRIVNTQNIPAYEWPICMYWQLWLLQYIVQCTSTGTAHKLIEDKRFVLYFGAI